MSVAFLDHYLKGEEEAEGQLRGSAPRRRGFPLQWGHNMGTKPGDCVRPVMVHSWYPVV